MWPSAITCTVVTIAFLCNSLIMSTQGIGTRILSVRTETSLESSSQLVERKAFTRVSISRSMSGAGLFYIARREREIS